MQHYPLLLKSSVIFLFKDELGYLLVSVRVAEEHAASAPKPEMDLIRQWVNNVKDVASNAVIILERFSSLQHEHEAPKQGVLYRMWNFIRMFCRKEANLYDIGKEIESLKERVIEIKNRHDQYGITNILTTPMVSQRKRPLLRATSFENLVDVVGFENDVKTLSHFKSCAWVCVSQEYDIKDVLDKIIKSVEGNEVDLSKMDEVDLLRHLRKLLQDRDRNLVVIDDIWDIEVWEKIKKALPDNKNGSRVIITTRNRNIAQKIDDKCFVHELRFLTENESWQLFCKRAKPAGDLENLGRGMVGKCGGLPLAIVVLSGLLLHKKSSDWFKVKDHIWRHLKRDSVEIKQILSLSYADLSFQMRQCFLYLARFPKDHNFEVSELKLLWIAEEFISEVEGVVMEDVAEEFLNELINRNMIQVVELLWDGQARKCRLHDLVRDLAIQKAAEDKLLGIFDSNKQHPSPISLLQGQPRHAIYNGISKYLELLESIPDDFKLHSLALINDDSAVPLKLEEMKLMYTRFKYVRVLVLTGVRTEVIPQEIGDLVLLKFLGLMGGISDKPLVIPSSIGKLKKLQTLWGSERGSYEIPTDICEWKELRHLYFYRIGMSSSIGRQQTKLQTIGYIRYRNWIQIDTLNLSNLLALGIRAEKRGDVCSLEAMVILTSLQKFSLQGICVIPTIKPLSSCQRLKNVTLQGKIKDPSELRFLPDSLTDLTLIYSELVQDPMPALGNLSNLVSLYLDIAYMGSEMVCNGDAFPSLQLLRLHNLFFLKEWQVEDGAMPSLRYFTMSICPYLQTLPKRLECLPLIPEIFYKYSDSLIK